MVGVAMPDVIGREGELARLDDLVGRAHRGHGQIAVISGEAGIGKTRLASELLLRSPDLGFTVYSGAADEVERRRPFGVVADALRIDRGADAARAEVAELLDGAAHRGRYGVEARIADLLDTVVRDACSRGPVALILDDLQWADESSMVAARRIAGSAAARPLLLICVLRPYPTDLGLRALLAALDYRGAQRIDLEGLSADRAAELATLLGGAPPGPNLRRMLAETGGNPLYIGQLLAGLGNGGIGRISDAGFLEVDAPQPPPTLTRAVLDTLRYLPDATLEALRSAAVVGRTFTVSEVAWISPTGLAEVAGALARAERAGIVIADGDRLAFRHDLIRASIYEDLAPAVRAGLHRHLASRLAETGAPPERIAAQLMLGAAPGDAEAIAWLRRAAVSAAVSPGLTADLLTRALDIAGDDGPPRRELLGELVRPLLWAGRAERAEQVCAEGLAGERVLEEESLFWVGLANAKLLQGRLDQARSVCREALAGMPLDRSDRLSLMVVEALCGIYMGDPAGIDLARSIVATAPESAAKVTAQDAIGQWELMRGRADLAVATYERARSPRGPVRVESRIWQDSGARVGIWHGLALLALDRLDEAAELFEADIAAEVAIPALPHAFLAACRYHGGRFDDAIKEGRAAVAAAEAAGSFMPASASAIAAVIALRRGRPDEAETLSLDAERVRTPAEAAGDTIVRWARTLVLESQGHTDAAADAAGGALDAYLRVGLPSYLTWHAPDLVRVMLAAGRAEAARRVVELAERSADQLAVASRRVGALRARATLDGDTAAQLAAVDAAREAPRPVDLACALRDAAGALAGDGHKDRAREYGAEALELFGRLGATGDERAARAMLRSAGLVLGSRARHRAVRVGWDSLTAAELRVVRLLVEGRSNPEIATALHLSRRTVGWHLSNMYRKLEVSSRVELVSRALRDGLITDPAQTADSANPEKRSSP